MPLLILLFLSSPCLLLQAKDLSGLKRSSVDSSQTCHQIHSPLTCFPCCLPVHHVLLQYFFHQPDPKIAPACKGEMDGEDKRNHKNCSSEKIMLFFSAVTFYSCVRNQSFKDLYFSLLSFFSLPVFPFLLFSSFFFPFLPNFRTTILCEEGRSILFTDTW